MKSSERAWCCVKHVSLCPPTMLLVYTSKAKQTRETHNEEPIILTRMLAEQKKLDMINVNKNNLT